MKTKPLAPQLLANMDAYWRTANYLSVGQIYLAANPLLKRPLALADKLIEHRQYINKHGQDLPEVRNWRWSNAK